MYGALVSCWSKSMGYLYVLEKESIFHIDLLFWHINKMDRTIEEIERLDTMCLFIRTPMTDFIKKVTKTQINKRNGSNHWRIM